MSEQAGSISFGVDLDSRGVEQGAQRAVSAMGNIIDSAQQTAQSVSAGVQKSTTGFSNMAKAAQQVASGVRTALGGEQMDQYTAKMDRLNAQWQVHKAKIEEAQTRYIGLREAASTFVETLQASEATNPFGKITEAARETYDAITGVSQEVAVHEQAMSDLEQQMSQTEAEYNAYKSSLSDTAPYDAAKEAARELKEQQAAAAEESSKMKTGIDTTAMAFQTIGRASGGALGNITGFAMQIRQLKKSMDETRATAGGFAQAMTAAVAGIGLAIMAVSMIISAIENEKKAREEARKSAVEAGKGAVEYLQSYTKEINTMEYAIRVLKDTASSVVELAKARDYLAERFPELVLGYDREGQAILAGNDAIEARLALEQKTAQYMREVSSYTQEVTQQTLAQKREELQTTKDQAAEYLVLSRSHISYIKQRDEALDRYKQLATEVASLEVQYNQQSMDRMRNMIIGWDNLSAAQKLAHDKIAAAGLAMGELSAQEFQDLAHNAYTAISNFQLVAEAEEELYGKRETLVADTIALLDKQAKAINMSASAYLEALQRINNEYSLTTEEQLDMESRLRVARKAAMDEELQLLEHRKRMGQISNAEYLQGLQQINDTYMKNARDQLDMDYRLKQARDAAYDFSDAIGSLNDLGSAYQTLNKGEQLSLSNLMQMINKYPEVARYIAETGDLTLQNGKILEYIFQVQQQEFQQKLQIERDKTQTTLDAVRARIESYKQEAQALLALNNMYSDVAYSTLSSSIQSLEREASALQGNIDQIDSRLKALGQITISNIGAGSAARRAASKSAAQDRNQEYQDMLKVLEHRKRMEEISTAEYLALLENINLAYKKSIDEQMDMDFKLFQTRRDLIEEQMSQEDRLIAYRKKMGELQTAVLQDEIALLEKRVQMEGLTADQIMDIQEDLYARKQELFDREMSDMERRRRMGGDSVTILQAEIDMLAQRLANEQLSAQQIMDIEEELYDKRAELVDARRALLDKEMSDQDRWFQYMTKTGHDMVEQEIEMLELRLKAYELTAEQIMAIEERLYALRQELADRELKEIEAANRRRIEAETKRLQAIAAAWKAWENEAIKAIDSYIDALRKLKQEEDRASKDAEEQRKIDAVRLKLAYEQDAYNKQQLQKELDRLETERAKRLREQAIDDQITALNDAKSNIKELSKERQDAIKEEIQAVKDGQKELSELTASGEKAMMSVVDQQLSILGTEYKSEFKDLGVVLGQSISDGIKDAVQRALEAFYQMTTDYTRQIQSQASGYANQLGPNIVDITQYRQGLDTRPITINFYEPVPSPYEFQKRMEEIDRNLAAGMY